MDDWYTSEDAGNVRIVQFSDFPAKWTVRRFLPVGVNDLAMSAADDAAGARVILLGCTVAWSYGSVDAATLQAEVPQHHYDLVNRMMGDMYRPLAERRARIWQNGSLSPSEGAKQSLPS